MERGVTFDDGRLLGILSEPASKTDQPLLLILNAGLLYRVGPARLSVELARSAEEAGFASFRFDISGFGDSEPRSVPLGPVESAVADAKAAMDHLGRHFGYRRFVVAGLCSGATQSHHVAVADDRVVGAVLVDGYVFPTLRSRLAALAERLGSPVRLTHLVLRKAWRSVRRLSQPQPAAAAGAAGEMFPWPPPAQVASDLALLRGRGVALLCVFSGEWARYRYVGQLADTFRDVAYGSRLVERRNGRADHLHLDRPARQELLETVGAWLEGRPWTDAKAAGNAFSGG